MSSNLGPCIRDLCTADAVAHISCTLGPSARLTVVTGPRASELADALPDTALNVVCADHAAQALEELLRGGV